MRNVVYPAEIKARADVLWERADAIKEARGRLRMTQTQFGALVGRTKAVVANWETARTMPPTLEELGLVGRAGSLPEPKTTQAGSPYQENRVSPSGEAA